MSAKRYDDVAKTSAWANRLSISFYYIFTFQVALIEKIICIDKK